MSGHGADGLEMPHVFRHQYQPDRGQQHGGVAGKMRGGESGVNAVSKFPTCAVGKFPSTDMVISH
ncbi:hypothetical protein SXCC_01470 [Gluconacetobacter sp. SXCC-1]|nr:hypothetical protein SXCC_01470 [Gluconacetobacter sp. SXCC-1]